MAANPNLIQAGQTLNIPGQQGQGAQQGGQTGQQNIPQTGQQAQQGQGAGGIQLCHPFADPENLGAFAIYVVRGGDSLTSIARRYGTTVRDLQVLNPHVQESGFIYTSQWILLHPGERVVGNPPDWQNACGNRNQ